MARSRYNLRPNQGAVRALLQLRRDQALSSDFDIILMDLQMPVMDGYTATHKLRAAGYQKPVVALTAHAMNEVRQKCLNVGCTAHLPKPINPKELVLTIGDLIRTKDH